ncbi:hypothetical protein [Streptomyces sp. NBC_00829]|nr:hypothetical protein OG293_37110 [Streptomyces sp. NBC_00829]
MMRPSSDEDVIFTSRGAVVLTRRARNLDGPVLLGAHRDGRRT